jgi:flagellin
MGLRIQNNVEAFNTHRQLTTTSTAAAKSMEKLSSGYRINRAADDAAGLAISEKMRGQIGGLAQAQRNAQDGISLVQTAEGALTEVHSMLQRVRDLKVQFNNGTNSVDDKTAIAAEVAQISQEVGNIVTQTKFNGTAVFGSNSFSFQVATRRPSARSPPISRRTSARPARAVWPSSPRCRPRRWPTPGSRTPLCRTSR